MKKDMYEHERFFLIWMKIIIQFERRLHMCLIFPITAEKKFNAWSRFKTIFSPTMRTVDILTKFYLDYSVKGW